MKINSIKIAVILSLVILPLFMSISHSQQITTSFTETQDTLLPLVFLALLVDSVIIAIWYVIGVVLNNGGVKSGAIAEFWQFIGTIIIVFIVTFFLILFSSFFYSFLSQNSNGLMSRQTLTSMCGDLASTSKLSILSPTYSVSGNSVLSPYGLCPIVSGKSTGITSQINYPTAAVGVVLANLTNQTATNLNSLFIEDAFIGFLTSLKPQLQICIQPGPAAENPCLNPLQEGSPLFEFDVIDGPWSGYSMIYDGYGILGDLLDLSTQAFVVQLVVLLIMLQIWPYLLFGGFILRATPFTRKIGGLLIAIAVGAVLIYPTIFAIEYLTLGNGTGNAFAPPGSGVNVSTAYGFNSIYSPNSITFIPASPDPANTTPYKLNFFVMPSVSTAMAHLECWPSGGNLLSAEVEDLIFTFLPGSILLFNPFNFASFGSGSLSNFGGLPAGCSPSGALQSLVMNINIYGVTGIPAFFLPIINLLITLSAILGLSGILGGTTKLLGLDKLI